MQPLIQRGLFTDEENSLFLKGNNMTEEIITPEEKAKEKAKLKALTSIFPQDSNVYIGDLKHEFTIKKVTISIDAWLAQEFGSAQRAGELIDGGDPTALMKLFYKMLSIPDKQYLHALKVESDLDENGKEVEVTNVIQKLLYICNPDNVLEIYQAILLSRGKSSPTLDEMVKKINRGSKKK